MSLKYQGLHPRMAKILGYKGLEHLSLWQKLQSFEWQDAGKRREEEGRGGKRREETDLKIVKASNLNGMLRLKGLE